MDYLADAADQAAGGLDLALTALLGRQTLTRGTARDLYWTPAQMVAHHTVGGCDLRPGDLFGTGTISGPTPGSEGSLLELTEGGRRPLRLDDGTQRRFLEDGDAVTLAARFGACGFGPCEGRITP